MIRQDQDWIEVIDLRNAVEHPKSTKGPLRIRDFAFEVVDGEPQVVEPVWWTEENHSELILQEMEVLQHNLLTFYEELQVILLMDSLESPLPIGIYEVPEEDRDPKNPIRFRVGLAAPLPGTAEEAGN